MSKLLGLKDAKLPTLDFMELWKRRLILINQLIQLISKASITWNLDTIPSMKLWKPLTPFATPSTFGMALSSLRKAKPGIFRKIDIKSQLNSNYCHLRSQAVQPPLWPALFCWHFHKNRWQLWTPANCGEMYKLWRNVQINSVTVGATQTLHLMHFSNNPMINLWWNMINS